MTHIETVIECSSYSGADNAILRDSKGVNTREVCGAARRKLQELNFTYRRL